MGRDDRGLGVKVKLRLGGQAVRVATRSQGVFCILSGTSILYPLFSFWITIPVFPWRPDREMLPSKDSMILYMVL